MGGTAPTSQAPARTRSSQFPIPGALTSTTTSSPGDEVLVHSVPLRHQGARAETFLAPGGHVAA